MNGVGLPFQGVLLSSHVWTSFVLGHGEFLEGQTGLAYSAGLKPLPNSMFNRVNH